MMNTMEKFIKQEEVNNKKDDFKQEEVDTSKKNEFRRMSIELPKRIDDARIYAKTKFDDVDSRIDRIIVLVVLWIVIYFGVIWWFVHK